MSFCSQIFLNKKLRYGDKTKDEGKQVEKKQPNFQIARQASVARKLYYYF